MFPDIFTYANICRKDIHLPLFGGFNLHTVQIKNTWQIQVRNSKVKTFTSSKGSYFDGINIKLLYVQEEVTHFV